MSNPIETLAEYADRLAGFAAHYADATALAYGGAALIEKTRAAVAAINVPAPDPSDAIIAELVAALGRAESFMAGFEDDELQEGMDGLLGSARAALANAAALQAGQ
jgi:hypothetical protein